MDSTIYFEIFVLVNVLFGDVLCYYFVGPVARTAAEIASRPQMPPPKLLFQVRKLGQQMVRRTPFQPLNRLMVTCGGSEINRCTGSFDTCPFMIDTSCCPQISGSDPTPASRSRLAVLASDTS
jgi:hypothetical protein